MLGVPLTLLNLWLLLCMKTTQPSPGVVLELSDMDARRWLSRKRSPGLQGQTIRQLALITCHKLAAHRQHCPLADDCLPLRDTVIDANKTSCVFLETLFMYRCECMDVMVIWQQLSRLAQNTFPFAWQPERSTSMAAFDQWRHILMSGFLSQAWGEEGEERWERAEDMSVWTVCSHMLLLRC